MNGKGEFEKMNGGKKGESKEKKPRIKRGGVRKIPYASAKTVPAEMPPVLEVEPEETEAPEAEKLTENNAEDKLLAPEPVKETLDQKKMSSAEFNERYKDLLDVDLFSEAGDSLRIVSKYYNESKGTVGAWLNPKGGKSERIPIRVEEIEEYLEKFNRERPEREKGDFEQRGSKYDITFEGVIQSIEEEKTRRLRWIREGKLTPEEQENPKKLFIIVPEYQKIPFGRLSEKERAEIAKRMDEANKEILAAWNLWDGGQNEAEVESILETGSVPDKRVAGNGRGQLAEDKFEAGSKTFAKGAYHNGSNPHDAEKALKEKPKGKELEKELDAKKTQALLEEAEGAWNDLEGAYLSTPEKRRNIILSQKVAQQLEDGIMFSFGFSAERAAEIADKIVSKMLAEKK